MLFRTLIKAWRGVTFLNEVMDQFDFMLQEGERMFRITKGLFFEEKDPGLIKDEIRSKDIKINKMERKIRKKLVQHISMNPGEDTIAAMVMMSVVKDAERIGDYCKNFLEVGELLSKPISGKWRNIFSRLFSEVEMLFSLTRSAFFETSKEHAERVLEKDYSLAHDCDRLLEEVAGSDLSTNSAVCYTLLLRYLKRVAAHLGNIASAVVQPVHKIDFFGGRTRQD